MNELENSVHQSGQPASQSLVVDIIDSTSDGDEVKFTVRTKTTLSEYKRGEFSVTRRHEDFIWLYQKLLDYEEFSRIQIPQPPSKPNFDTQRETLRRLGDDIDILTEAEIVKAKEDIKADYKIIFREALVTHNEFLHILAAHPVLRTYYNFRVFLEYEQDLSERTKDLAGNFGSACISFMKSSDRVHLPRLKIFRSTSRSKSTELMIADNGAKYSIDSSWRNWFGMDKTDRFVLLGIGITFVVVFVVTLSTNV